MNVKELYSFCSQLLMKGEIEDFNFECDCLFEEAGFNRVKRLIEPSREISPEIEAKLLSSVKRRINGEPLQYILGKWEFMGLNFFVGEGVLIPRPETEMLVELADKCIKTENIKTVFDLCSGSGAVGLSIAKFNPLCKVYLFEKYDEAFIYLKKNATELNLTNVELVKCDIFDFTEEFLPKAELIVSNPPYIKNSEIPSLQKEVGYEPKTALDGGADGLNFYRCIREKWLDRLKNGGKFLFECGDGQAEEIIRLFSGRCFNSSVHFDFNNIDRVVEINV